jgi:hypothetical protein
MRRRHLIAPDGIPCNPPPWGTLTAIDIESGDVKWERPMGRIARLSGLAGSEQWGSPNLGGAMTTAGGIVFAGGAIDSRLHAYDVETGAELWSALLPAGAHASPMTYVSSSGKHYVVVAAGGHRELSAAGGPFDKAGDFIVAFALPSSSASQEPGAVSAGHYEGHIVLDRTRLRMNWDLAVTGMTASVSLETVGTHVEGRGTGRVAGDSLFLDVAWTFPAQKCGGTLRLHGATANRDTAIVGELSYVDGCRIRLRLPRSDESNVAIVPQAKSKLSADVGVGPDQSLVSVDGAAGTTTDSLHPRSGAGSRALSHSQR